MDAERRRFSARLAVALPVVALLAAAPRRGDAQPGVTAVATDTRLTDSPVTARLAAGRPAAGTGAITVLMITDIHGHSVQPIRINVFVDKPDADHRTPTTDPQCAGFIQLLPRLGEIRPTGAILDLSAQMPAGRGGPVAITLVPVVGTDSAATQGVDLTIGRMLIGHEAE